MRNSHKNKISTLGSQVTSAVSVALVLILLGLMAMAMVTSARLAADIRSNVGIVVKLLPGAADQEVKRVERLIARQAGVASQIYSTPDEILTQESELMGDDISEILDENPFGGEFAVTLLPDYANTDSIARMCKVIAEDPTVDEIVTETEVVDSINSFLHRLSWGLFIAAAALLAISFVLINNTVSLAVYSRRFVIHTMKLVGATWSFIRRPFIMAGLFTGLASAAAAIAAVAAIRAWAATFEPNINHLLGWGEMTWIFLGIILAGPAICAGASALATNRYLRANYDDLFRS